MRDPHHALGNGRGGVRTSDLSRVKSDKEVDKPQETPGKKQDPGDAD
jgi:hypothetical protein